MADGSRNLHGGIPGEPVRDIQLNVLQGFDPDRTEETNTPIL